MTPFVILSWDGGNHAADVLARHIKTTLLPPDRWKVIADTAGVVVAVPPSGRFTAIGHCSNPTFIIGDIFHKSGSFSGTDISIHDDFLAMCREMADQRWGAYTAIEIRRDANLSVFRDPIGMRDVVTWTCSGLRVAATEPYPWLLSAPPDDVAIDWSRLGSLLADSSDLMDEPPLTGIRSIPAGYLVDAGPAHFAARRLWEPAPFFRRHTDQQGNLSSLRTVVIQSVSSWRSAYPKSVLEISGGFDSALVAAALSEGARPDCKAFNFFTSDGAGDERRYARDVASRHGVPLDEIGMDITSLSDTDLAGMPVGALPGLGSTTLFHDRRLAHEASAVGADCLFTGHGGDAVLFQHPTAMIASDPSFPRWDLDAHLKLARWSKTPLWTVARFAFRIPFNHNRATADDAMPMFPLVRHPVRPTPGWAGDLRSLPPAKRAHILAIAGERSAFGSSWRAAACPVIHPLLSQPIIEWAIATDTYTLTQGRRDRALARAAFAHILPGSIIDRRGKGGLNHFFGRTLAASIPFLRTFLLDGLLVRHGVLPRSELDAILNRDYLMQFDCYGKILLALVTEQWARTWQERLDSIRSMDSVSHSVETA